VLYKVFLVEDEIVAREGIRDNVDWKSSGFEFCGEAPDGEIALPLIEASQPDVLITDIKMPFMDGLQLCKIVREHLPWVKIVILSGYDEFNYAQMALKLGVTDYLLKPVGVQDLTPVLINLRTLLDQERSERESLKQLRNQVEDNLVLLREKFLLRLVLGGESSVAAIEQSQQLGLEILSKCYQVMLIKINISESGLPFDYNECQRVESLVAKLVGIHRDAFLTKKDMEELVIIFKGDGPDQLEQESAFLAGLIRQEVEEKTTCKLEIGLGKPQQRLGDLHRSFTEALVRVKDTSREVDNGGLRKLDQPALKNYLESGRADDFELFFDSTIRPVGEAALRSTLYKHYILLDIVLTNAQFVSDLGGNADQVIPENLRIEELLAGIQTLDQMRDAVKRVFTSALAYRDSQVNNDRAQIIRQAKDYIEGHYTDASLSLNQVAGQVNFSPSHFSAVFSHETGQSFKDFLTGIRISQAKKLLRMTGLKVSEIAFQCGYNDAHYFSMIFRKNTGLTPQQFREGARKSG